MDATGEPAVCYINVDLRSGRDQTVVVTADYSSPAPDMPASPRLLEAFPNPFNPRTGIGFDLDNPGNCRLTIFDLRGREVAVLAEGRLAAGHHTAVWNGIDSRGRAMPSGIYLASLRAGSFSATRKLTLAR